ncbi:RidA family protein [Bradyrhizobium sp.]|uniref:RidA family protein n=1 Tax=Bradyrhizobium sp. TaxID=376 RepID=UPI001E0F94A7|nr:RidA family protein [Bradyrhizobium sp.]MBV8700802.1 RidA family protein [Bradyrhizobium sp.]MBV8922168.1 RidA family protein [Bradyrhizobium sp.]MBV9978616.1 RidA family protein [Bradyrhizobium sp.]
MPNSIKAITTQAAPQPFGHYVQATEAAGVVYVSGQLAARADGASLADQPFEIQARQALANIIAIVDGAGLSRDRIAKVTAYIVGVEYWPAFNAIYADVFGAHRPARAVVPVPELHHGYLIELEAIAVR